MDRTAYDGRSISTQYFTQNPPWRSYQQPPKGTHGQVDSWRSYRNDVSNLQTSTTSARNAMAQPFEPPPQARQHYQPYQPLRVSNGTHERNVVQHNNAPKNKIKETSKRRGMEKLLSNAAPTHMAQPVEPSAAFARRYPVRSNRGLADQPIPFIEGPSTLSVPASGPAFRQLDYKARSRTKSPVAPETTAAYRAQAQQEPARLSDPRKLLVVLDLNGTLLYRTKAGCNKKMHVRPGVTPLVDYLFTNHVVMVYTSAMPTSAAQMVSQFLHPKYRNQLAAVWARDKLDLTKEQFENKVQVYKKLDKIWDDETVQKTAGAGNRWDQSNTILVDDSKLKALAQPHNLLQVPEYTANDDPAKAQGKRKQNHKIQQDILKQLEMKLEELKYQENVSKLIRRWQTGEIAVPKLPGQKDVVEETVDQKALKEEKSAEATKQIQPEPHLPTPDSIGQVSTREGESVDMPVQSRDDEDDSGAPLSPVSSTVSSINEDVFRELLEGTGK